MADISFRAMGSDCRVIVGGAALGAAARARGLVDELEGRWSRFLSDSEISWLNRTGGRPSLVSESTAALLRRAMYAMEQTNGLFDPLLLDELEALGYDRSHEQLGESFDPKVTSVTTGYPRNLSTTGGPIGLIELPKGRRIDPGGIGKGYAADLVAAQLVAEGADWVVVILGGDIRVAGSSLARTGIQIEVQDPWDQGSVAATVRIESGAVATSSTLRRRWQDSNGEDRHHLLDPRTALPATTDLVAATVIAGEAWWAEALAKAAVIGGSEVATELLGRHDASALLTRADASVQTIGCIHTEVAA